LPEWEKSSTARVIPPARPRKLAKVPFVELADGRLQGVVSSGSDIERVYVSSVAADGIYSFGCSTNNNRPCGSPRIRLPRTRWPPRLSSAGSSATWPTWN
jgi:hypothetical protein